MQRALPCLAMALACSGCFSTHCSSELPLCAPQGEAPTPHHETLAEIDARARHSAHEQRPRARRAFADGALCKCVDRTCGVAAAAAARCEHEGRTCVDEIMMHATEGGSVQLLVGSPRVLVRAGTVVSADGQLRAAILNRVPVRVEHRDASVLVPVGADLGETPHAGRIEVQDAVSPGADIAIDGVEYACPTG